LAPANRCDDAYGTNTPYIKVLYEVKMTQICELMTLSINNIINNNDKLNILISKEKT